MQLYQVVAGVLKLLAPATAVQKTTSSGLSSVYICPESQFRNGTRVASDVCVVQPTNPSCLTMPVFANVSFSLHAGQRDC